MCAEDVAEAGCDDLFDEDGFLVGVCPRHAELLMARAVDGRACKRSVCGGAAYGIDAGGGGRIAGVTAPVWEEAFRVEDLL